MRSSGLVLLNGVYILYFFIITSLERAPRQQIWSCAACMLNCIPWFLGGFPLLSSSLLRFIHFILFSRCPPCIDRRGVSEYVSVGRNEESACEVEKLTCRYNHLSQVCSSGKQKSSRRNLYLWQGTCCHPEHRCRAIDHYRPIYYSVAGIDH